MAERITGHPQSDEVRKRDTVYKEGLSNKKRQGANER